MTTKSPSQLADVMNKKLRVVMLRLVGLPGNRNLPDSTTTIGHGDDKKEIDRGIISDPTLRLLSNSWATRFNKVKGLADKLIRASSPPNAADRPPPLPGCDIVALERLPTLQTAMAQLVETQFMPLVAEFLASYPSILEELRGKINNDQVWAALVKRIPSVEELASAIRLRFEVVPVTFVGDEAAPFVREVIDNITHGLAQSVAEEVGRINDRLAHKTKFTKDSFNMLREKLGILKDFQFVLSSETADSVQDLEERLNKVTGQDQWQSLLNQELLHDTAQTSEELKTALTTLLGRCRADIGGKRRRIDI